MRRGRDNIVSVRAMCVCDHLQVSFPGTTNVAGAANKREEGEECTIHDDFCQSLELLTFHANFLDRLSSQ